MSNKNYLVTPKPDNIHEAFYADTLEITSDGFEGVDVMGDRYWCLNAYWCYEEVNTMENKEFQEEPKPFVEGQWVYSVQEGWEKITGIGESGDYPVYTIRNYYTLDGQYCMDDKHPSLFHTDIFNGTQPPEPEIDWDKVPRDTEVEVSMLGATWGTRHFSHKNENGLFFCFANGRKANKATNISSWVLCRLIHQSDIEKYSK